MTADSEFVKHIVGLLGPLGDVKARAMYSGYGIFHDGRVFAIISADSLLYFVTDETTREDYVKAGSSQYPDIPYYEVPLEVLADETSLLEWARDAIGADP